MLDACGKVDGETSYGGLLLPPPIELLSTDLSRQMMPRDDHAFLYVLAWASTFDSRHASVAHLERERAVSALEALGPTSSATLTTHSCRNEMIEAVETPTGHSNLLFRVMDSKPLLVFGLLCWRWCLPL